MMHRARNLALAVAFVAGASGAAAAQDTLRVGAPAPDFSLVGATRDGVLPAPVHLADFQGKTVVLAFFYKARTKG